MNCLINIENALKYTMIAIIMSAIYSLYAVSDFSCVPAMLSIDMNTPEKTTAIGLLEASNATGIPLKPYAGRLRYVDQKNSVFPAR